MLIDPATTHESRALDAQVATEVFGWTQCEPNCYVTTEYQDTCGNDPSGKGGPYDNGRKVVPRYSTSWNDTALIIEELQRRKAELDIFINAAGASVTVMIAEHTGQFMDENIKKAVCKAALAAIRKSKT